jgi:hypothetical protein
MSLIVAATSSMPIETVVDVLSDKLECEFVRTGSDFGPAKQYSCFRNAYAKRIKISTNWNENSEALYYRDQPKESVVAEFSSLIADEKLTAHIETIPGLTIVLRL